MKRLEIVLIILAVVLSLGFAVNAQEPFVWEQLETTGDVPAGRTGPKMLLNPVDNTAYIYGGMASLFESFTDTYALDLATNTWTLLDPEGTPPEGSAEGAIAVDYENVRLYYLDRAGSQGIFYDNVKVFDGITQTWTQLQTTPLNDDADNLPYCINGAMAYDSKENRLIYFGGSYWDQKLGNVYLDDTYILDLETNVWEKADIRGMKPPGNFACSAIYNSVENTFVVHGGQTAEWISGEFWQLDLERLRWDYVPTASPVIPKGRVNASMHYDPLGNRLFLFGGFDGSTFMREIEIFDFDDKVWSTVEILKGDKPEPRRGAASALFVPDVSEDSTNPYLLIFGGENDGNMLNDTWRIYFDLQQPPAKNPVMTLETSKDTYHLGDTLEVWYDLVNEGPAIKVDLIVALYHKSVGLLFFWDFTSEVSFFATDVELAAGERREDQPILSLKLESPIPTGVYTFYCAVVKDFTVLGDINSASFTYE